MFAESEETIGKNITAEIDFNENLMILCDKIDTGNY